MTPEEIARRNATRATAGDIAAANERIRGPGSLGASSIPAGPASPRFQLGALATPPGLADPVRPTPPRPQIGSSSTPPGMASPIRTPAQAASPAAPRPAAPPQPAAQEPPAAPRPAPAGAPPAAPPAGPRFPLGQSPAPAGPTSPIGAKPGFLSRATGVLANPWVGRSAAGISEGVRIFGKGLDGYNKSGAGGAIVEGGKEALGAPVRLGSAYAGAKGGAVLGGLAFGPPGAAIGGVAGGVGGYIAGDEVVDRIRNADAQSYAERFGVDFDPETASGLKRGLLYTGGALSELPGLLVGSAYPDQQPLSQTQIRQGADRTVEASQRAGTPVAPFPEDGEQQIAALQSSLAAAQRAADEARRSTPVAFAGRAGGPESIPQPDPASSERLRVSNENIAIAQSQLQNLLVAREAARRPPVPAAQDAAETPAEAAPAPESPAEQPRLDRYTPPTADGTQAAGQAPAAGQIFRVVGADGRVTFTDRPGAGEKMSLSQAPADPQAQAMRQGQEQQDAGQKQLQAMLSQARGDRLGVAQGAQGRLGKLYDAFNDQIAQGRRRTAAVIGEQIRAELGVLGQTASGQMIDPRTPDRTADMLRAQADAGLLGEQTQGARQENQNTRRLEFLRSIIFDPNASDADKQAAQSEFQSRTAKEGKQAEDRIVTLETPDGKVPMLVPPGQTTGTPIGMNQQEVNTAIASARQILASGQPGSQAMAKSILAPFQINVKDIE